MAITLSLIPFMFGQPLADRDPAVAAPSVDLSPGPEYADDQRPFQGIPGIERAPGGRLWATWYAGGETEGPENYVLLVTSGDDGATWSAPALVVDPPGMVRAYDPCLWVDPLGRLWLFWAQSYGWWDGRAGVWAIRTDQPDAAEPQWSEPRRLCDGIMMNKPVALSSGEWALPAAIWSIQPRTGDGEHTHELGERAGSNMVVSLDEGGTWEYRGGSTVPGRACDEHHIIELRDDRLWMLVRTDYGIGESYSLDRGRRWSPGRPSWIPHIPAARFFIRRLTSGNLLLVKHRPPDGRTRSHLEAYLSEDDGRSWIGGLSIDERASVSYPDATQSGDGLIYLIYDYDRTGGREILMATFREADVLAGQTVSPGARLGVLVNKVG
jgi:predicted neuraminidase